MLIHVLLGGLPKLLWFAASSFEPCQFLNSRSHRRWQTKQIIFAYYQGQTLSKARLRASASISTPFVFLHLLVLLSLLLPLLLLLSLLSPPVVVRGIVWVR